jgi:hypothetical protein
MDLVRQVLRVSTLVALAVILFLPASAVAAPPPEPKPIPGGIQLDPSTLIHVFAPGPKSQGFMGRDIEPNVITDFHGFVAMAYLNGTATGSDGKTYTVGYSDMRLFRGTYIGFDGLEHHGTFGFI